MLSLIGKSLSKTYRKSSSILTVVRNYSFEDPLNGKSDDYYHFTNLHLADMKRYDRFNYVQPTIVPSNEKILPFLSEDQNDSIQYQGELIRNPSLEYLSQFCNGQYDKDHNYLCTKPFIRPYQVEIYDSLSSTYIKDLKSYFQTVPRLFIEDSTLGGFLYNEIHTRIISDDPIYSSIFKHLIHRSPLFNLHQLPPLTIYKCTMNEKPFMIRGVKNGHAFLFINGTIDMDTIMNTIFRLTNSYFTTNKQTSLPDSILENSNNNNNKNSSLDRLQELEKEYTYTYSKEKEEEEKKLNSTLLNHYIMRSDILRSPDGNTCAIVGLTDKMRYKAYSTNVLFSAYHTLFFNNGISRVWGGIKSPIQESSVFAPTLSVNDSLYRGTTGDCIASFPSTFLILNDKCKQMTEFNYREYQLILREKSYDEKGITFLEKLFRYHKTECFYINPNLCDNVIDCMPTIPLKKIDKT